MIKIRLSISEISIESCLFQAFVYVFVGIIKPCGKKMIRSRSTIFVGIFETHFSRIELINSLIKGFQFPPRLIQNDFRICYNNFFYLKLILFEQMSIQQVNSQEKFEVNDGEVNIECDEDSQSSL
jgi:hypothetical protein